MRTLVSSGIEVCFANPGTSEMHFVAALDDVPEMRGVLCLFEGIATGAADGYGRMAERPSCTLLHLGAGLGNGVANLHNARRAGTPLLNIVGDHATDHVHLDTPLTSDIEAIASAVSGWVRTSKSVEALAADAGEAAAVAGSGQVATLIVPADLCWLDGAEPIPTGADPPAPTVEADLERYAELLAAGDQATILLSGSALSAAGQMAAAAIAAETGANLLTEVFPARQRRGAGLPTIERLAYRGESATEQLAGYDHLLLVGADEPFTFFAYPDKPSRVAPESCAIHDLTADGGDAETTIIALAQLLDAPLPTIVESPASADLPSGPITPRSLAAVIGGLLPAEAVVSDESNTSGFHLPAATADSPQHDWLCLAGGAIGQGLPVAVGAAVACPDRKVLALEADGSAMYTPQALWTQARESLDVTTLIINNGSYAVLNLELDRVGADPSSTSARDLLDLGRPDLDFVSLAESMGVPGRRVETAEDLASHLQEGLATDGPSLIEVMLARRPNKS